MIWKKELTSIKKTIGEMGQKPFIQKKHQQRLAMLSGSVGMIKVGADSKGRA